MSDQPAMPSVTRMESAPVTRIAAGRFGLTIWKPITAAIASDMTNIASANPW